MNSILITGCSSGIGYDAATTLQSQGWQVLATCRQQEDCDALEKAGLTSFVLDYADESSVKTAVERSLELTGGKIDALFNNGAYATPGLVEDLTRGAMREIFEVNLFGQMDLTNLLLPAMRENRPMRENRHGYIINNSSVLGLAGMPFRGAYCATKFAMEGLTDALRLELSDSGIHVSLIEPGPITTKIRENSIPHFEKWINVKASAQKERYESVMIPRLYRDTGAPDKFELPPSAVTAKLLKILNSPKPRPRYYVTTPTYITGTLKRILSSRALDRVMLKA